MAGGQQQIGTIDAINRLESLVAAEPDKRHAIRSGKGCEIIDVPETVVIQRLDNAMRRAEAAIPQALSPLGAKYKRTGLLESQSMYFNSQYIKTRPWAVVRGHLVSGIIIQIDPMESRRQNP
jgi:hypothetical protein